MIKSFRDSETEAIFNGASPRRFPRDLAKRVLRKLEMIDAAPDRDALRIPPNNRLKQLKGDRKGQWAIRVNQQYRICFEWRGDHAWNVELVDYHR